MLSSKNLNYAQRILWLNGQNFGFYSALLTMLPLLSQTVINDF